MIAATGGGYAAVVSLRVETQRQMLAGRWLERLKELLTVSPNEVFPSQELLDHIPSLIAEIALYLRAPVEEEIAANTAVMDKARELGMLRHQQQASVHQLLREYETLGEILESFVVQETERLAQQPTAAEAFELLRRLTRATRTLMRTTVDTFVSEYTATIQERNERIKTFNRMASHELRSPIGTLLFAAAALKIDGVRSDPARLTKVAATIRSNAERMSWLVENLQRLARLGDAIDVPSQQQVDLGMLASEVARQLDEMALGRGVAIRIADGLPVLMADPARLELVLVNLISNAIKYSDPDKAGSFVEIAPGAGDDAASCVICVRDNGLGIADGDQVAIFDRFFRAHSHLDGEHAVSGTGLGLAIVAECIQALGGSIRCESTLGEGASFFVTLPRLQPPPPAPA